ncbi:MAG: hypothetical protein QME79_09575 [Bacillota bacterium]|nr:hypothetical protein [Bacillota bacterium]
MLRAVGQLVAWSLILLTKAVLAALLVKMASFAHPLLIEALVLYVAPAVLTGIGFSLTHSWRTTLIAMLTGSILAIVAGSLVTPPSSLGMGVIWAGRIVVEGLSILVTGVTLALLLACQKLTARGVDSP